MAQQTIAYKVYDVIGEIALSPAKGVRITALIAPHIRAGRHITLDFTGVKVVLPPFLQAIVEPLMQDLDPNTVRQRLTVMGLDEIPQQVLYDALGTAHRWYHDVQYRTAIEARRAELAEETRQGDAD